MKSRAPMARYALIRKIRTHCGSYHGDAPPEQRGFRKILTGPAHPDYLPFCKGPGHGTGYQDQIIIEAHDFLKAIDTGEAIWPSFQAGLEVQQSLLLCAPRMRREAGRLSANFDLRGTPNMTILIGNAPCSWGVEFADDPRNPDWRTVLKQNAEAGYKGIELGPVGFMPEDPPQVADALAENGHGADRWRRVPRLSRPGRLG